MRTFSSPVRRRLAARRPRRRPRGFRWSTQAGRRGKRGAAEGAAGAGLAPAGEPSAITLDLYRINRHMPRPVRLSGPTWTASGGRRRPGAGLQAGAGRSRRLRAHRHRRLRRHSLDGSCVRWEAERHVPGLGLTSPGSRTRGGRRPRRARILMTGDVGVATTNLGSALLPSAWRRYCAVLTGRSNRGAACPRPAAIPLPPRRGLPGGPAHAAPQPRGSPLPVDPLDAGAAPLQHLAWPG